MFRIINIFGCSDERETFYHWIPSVWQLVNVIVFGVNYIFLGIMKSSKGVKFVKKCDKPFESFNGIHGSVESVSQELCH